MSVVIAAESRGVESVIHGHQGYALAAFTAGQARACGQRIVRAPTADEPAHVFVAGRKTDSIRRRLARGRWEQWSALGRGMARLVASTLLGAG